MLTTPLLNFNPYKWKIWASLSSLSGPTPSQMQLLQVRPTLWEFPQETMLQPVTLLRPSLLWLSAAPELPWTSVVIRPHLPTRTLDYCGNPHSLIVLPSLTTVFSETIEMPRRFGTLSTQVSRLLATSSKMQHTAPITASVSRAETRSAGVLCQTLLTWSLLTDQIVPTGQLATTMKLQVVSRSHGLRLSQARLVHPSRITAYKSVITTATSSMVSLALTRLPPHAHSPPAQCRSPPTSFASVTALLLRLLPAMSMESLSSPMRALPALMLSLLLAQVLTVHMEKPRIHLPWASFLVPTPPLTSMDRTSRPTTELSKRLLLEASGLLSIINFQLAKVTLSLPIILFMELLTHGWLNLTMMLVLQQLARSSLRFSNPRSALSHQLA